MTAPEMWGAFGGLVTLALVLFGLMPLWWIARGYPKGGQPAVPFTVSGLGAEPGGTLTYREGEHELQLDWELGPKGLTVARIYVPDEASWVGEVPWAADRREDVLDRVAAEVKRQRCAGCRWEVREDVIELFER